MVTARAPRLALAAAIVVGALTSAGPVAAQPSPYGAGEARTAPATPLVDRGDPLTPAVPPSSGEPLPPSAPGSVMRRPEQLGHKPSGFWTSNRPAEGGAYRWRIMAAGGLVLAISIFFVVRLIRRAGRERALAAR